MQRNEKSAALHNRLQLGAVWIAIGLSVILR
jgi:hypothetical protein